MTSLRGLHLHLEPTSGIAGDMLVAALVDAGVPPGVVVDAIAAVGVPGLRVGFEPRRRGAFVGQGFVVDWPGNGHARGGGATSDADHAHQHSPAHSVRESKARQTDDLHEHEHEHAGDHGARHHDHHRHVHAPVVQVGKSAASPGTNPDRRRPRRSLRRRPAAASPAPGPAARPHEHDHHHRDYADIRRLLAGARIDAEARALAQEVFARLAEVEGALHGTSIDRVTFHEVGAFDSIADIVGLSAAVAWLAPASIGSSPPVVGTGTVQTAHGLVPVPAPATAALLRGLPLIADGQGELTTPTGAAFLAVAVDRFGPPPPMRLVGVGYGAGTRELADRANVLRVLLGEPLGQPLTPSAEDVLVVETNIDDMTGQLLAALADALFKAGALDVWFTPIIMKKGRPAQQVSALVEPAALDQVERAFFLNSSTLGLRRYPVARRTLARSNQQAETAFGAIGVKVSALDGAVLGAAPEYEDCRRAAARAGVPVRRVWTAAVVASAALGGDVVQASAPALIAARGSSRKGGKQVKRPRRSS